MQGGSVVACTMRKRGGEAEPLLKSVKVPPVRVVWPVFHLYRYDTGIWGFIDSFRVVLVSGMRKW